MGKTMFGIPGVKDKSQSGGAIAPRGTGGGSQGAGDHGAGNKNQSSQQRQSKHQEKKAPMAAPAMAKPRPAVASGAQPHVTPRKKSDVSKTMFGMPAMNLQSAQAATQSTADKKEKADGNTEAGKPVSQTSDSQSSSGKTENGDVYGATMLGVPAVSDEMARTAVEQERQAALDADALAITEMPDVAPSEDIPQVSPAVAPGGTMIQPAVTSAASAPESELAAGPEVQNVETVSETEVAQPVQTETDADTGQNAEIEISTPEQIVSNPLQPVEGRSGAPSKGLVIGLVVGFLVMIGAIVFVAWKFLYS